MTRPAQYPAKIWWIPMLPGSRHPGARADDEILHARLDRADQPRDVAWIVAAVAVDECHDVAIRRGGADSGEAGRPIAGLRFDKHERAGLSGACGGHVRATTIHDNHHIDYAAR